MCLNLQHKDHFFISTIYFENGVLFIQYIASSKKPKTNSVLTNKCLSKYEQFLKE